MCILTSSALSGRLRILCFRKFSVLKKEEEEEEEEEEEKKERTISEIA